MIKNQKDERPRLDADIKDLLEMKFVGVVDFRYALCFTIPCTMEFDFFLEYKDVSRKRLYIADESLVLIVRQAQEKPRRNLIIIPPKTPDRNGRYFYRRGQLRCSMSPYMIDSDLVKKICRYHRTPQQRATMKGMGPRD